MKKLLHKLGVTLDDSVIEKRREERHEAFFTALVKKGDKRIPVTIVNFSKSGLGMKIPAKLAAKENVEIDLSINSERHIKATFNVQCSRPIGDEYIIGAKLSGDSSHYADFFNKMSQPRHTVMSDCW